MTRVNDKIISPIGYRPDLYKHIKNLKEDDILLVSYKISIPDDIKKEAQERRIHIVKVDY